MSIAKPVVRETTSASQNGGVRDDLVAARRSAEGIVPRSRRRSVGARSAFSALIAVLAMLLAACSGSNDATSGGSAESGTSASGTGQAVSGELNVFAAASLKEAFEQIAADLEADNPDLTIHLQYGASGQLAAQIQQGAPADVFASADETSMKTLTDAGLVPSSEVFATNKLQIVVPAGNPGKVASIDDLTKPDLLVVTCTEAAACGKTQEKIEDALGITLASDSREPDVKSVLQKVAMGEADAGLVYVTDVKSAGDKVEGIDFPEAGDFANAYPIGVTRDAANPEAAKAFVAAVLSDAGQKVLQQKGFGAP